MLDGNPIEESSMKQVSEGVYYIPGQDEFIPDSHAYVIGKPSTGDLSLVDAGLMGKGRYKTQSIIKSGIELSDIKRVIMTHIHLDHIGCLQEILQEIPRAEIWVHTDEAEFLEKGDDRAVYGMDMFKSFSQSQYGLETGAFSFQVDRRLQGGETFEVGGMNWEVIHAPGHSRGGIALYTGQGGVLIPGDVVYADYAIGRFDLYGASGVELEKSLLSLAELDVKILLPGHNRIVEDLPEGYILKTAKQWGPYLR
jgi:glyoxylase-like metal-dependent hydrolase (beta-lactamase superfamily II)